MKNRKNITNALQEAKPTSLRDLGPKYSTAFVTFIDILGFKELVVKQKAEKLNSILDKMCFFFTSQSQQRREPYCLEKHLPMILQFSDSIVRIQPVTTSDQETSVLDFFVGELEALLLAQGNLICNGVLIRGGLTYGEVCVHKDRIFGPAFMRAYQIESSLARYPRIVIDDALCQNGSSNPLYANYGHLEWSSAMWQILEF